MEFRSLTDNESASLVNSVGANGQKDEQDLSADPSVFNGVTSDKPPNVSPAQLDSQSVQFRTLEAPHNTVYDQDNDRVVSVPQTLTPDETGYVIKRDVDQVKNFFAMEDVGGFDALGRGVESFFASQPQVLGGLMKEQGELLSKPVNISRDVSDTQSNVKTSLNEFFKGFGIDNVAGNIQSAVDNLFNGPEIVKAANQLVQRNKKYMSDAGLERPEQGGVSGIMYDIGQGSSSMLSALGLAALTRSPETAGLYFGAIQKASVYQEARAAGKSPDEAGDISSLAGVVEGGLEFVGLDHFIKAIKGNSAVVRFVNGFAIEATQEGSQQIGEESITQLSNVRKNKPIAETVKDILYQAALGGILGGSSSAAIGAFAKKSAQDQGVPEPVADQLSKYTEEHVESSKQNMTEFIDKELAPIAKDDQSAQEFMTLMQKFGNDQNLVERDSLDPETRAVFDKYVDIFNNSKVDSGGVTEAEKSFYTQAINAGVDEDQAVAASKLIGARADAASRALGVTPQEWLKSKKIELKVDESTISSENTEGEMRFQGKVAQRNQRSPITKEAVYSLADELEKKHKITLSLALKGDDIRINNIIVPEGSRKSGIGTKAMEDIANFADDNGVRVILSAATKDDRHGTTSSARLVSFYKRFGFKENKGSKKDFTVNDGMIRDPRLKQDNNGVRGSVTFGQDGSTLINLFKGRNASTLFHELGHIFLRDMRDVSKITNRPRVKADYEAVKKWLGAKGDGLTVAQEEKFARGFEAYLREGKAPKPELQSVFNSFKKWLESVYDSVKKLNVNLTPEIRQVFDRMLGADFAMSEKLNQEIAARNIEEDYDKVANYTPASTFREDTAAVFNHAIDLAADAFVPVSTRLGNINEGLKHAVRKFVFQTGLYSHEDRVALKPFIEQVSNKMDEQDYRRLDLALKNRDTVKTEFLIDKYGLQKEWKAVREVLDGLYNEARDVGIDVSYIDDYFPRKVKRDKVIEYMAAIRNQEAWGQIEHAMREADPNGTFTAEEQAEFVNNFLRGFSSARINLSRSGFTKERSVNYVTPEFNKYYQDSLPTLMEYVGGVRHGIESRKLFGKSEKETDQNIGAYVLNLVKQGVIDAKQEGEVSKLLKAVVEPTGTRGAVSWAKNASYIYLMGNPISAISQIQDLAFSLHKNGYYRTTKSLLKSLTGKAQVTKEDIGVEDILQEFTDKTRASDAVRKVFKAVGLEFMDNIGKEVYLDASLGRLQKAAKSGGKEFIDGLKTIFGDEAAQTKKDLLDGALSENVKYLLFSEISDIQPISLAEMPVGYLRGGNGRIFYMLKSYTLKQLDIYRREIVSNLASGDVKKTATGLKNFISLGASLMLMGLSSDALKDFLLGREINLDDLITDNMLKLMGFTKYQIYKARDDGIANTFFMTLFVPSVLAPLDDVGKDIIKTAKGKQDLKDAKTLSRVPVVGNFYYWWLGGGHTKMEKKKGSNKLSTP